MRRLKLVFFAAAIAFPAAPGFAQYGGSPEEQQEAYDQAADPAYGPDLEDGDQPPPDDYYQEAEYDPDPDYDADADVDVDADVDRDDDGGVSGGGYQGQSWRGEDGRTYCRRSDGTTGLVVGAGAGALIGRGIDTRGERGTGTILGAVAGALIGSAVERGARCAPR